MSAVVIKQHDFDASPNDNREAPTSLRHRRIRTSSYISVSVMIGHPYRGLLAIVALNLIGGNIIENFFAYLRWLGNQGILAKHLPPLAPPLRS